MTNHWIKDLSCTTKVPMIEEGTIGPGLDLPFVLR